MELNRASIVYSNPLAVASELIRKQLRARSPSAHLRISPSIRSVSPPMWTKAQTKPRAEEIVTGERLLCIKEVCAKVSMGKSTIYRWAKEGRFPCGIEFAPQLVRWRESAIDAWITAVSSGAR